MYYSELYENKKRGTFDFPIELYRVDESSPRYQMPLHWHLEYELILVKEGSFTLSMDGKSTILNEGDCAWIGDGTVHGGIPNDCIYECVVFDLGTLLHDTPVCAKSAGEFISGDFTSVFRKGSECSNLAENLFRCMEKEEQGYEWITVGLMWQLMGTMISLRKEPAPISRDRVRINKIKNVLTFIRCSYHQAVTLDELAQVAGMTPRYFCRAFKEFTGKSPVEYLNFYRIQSAGEKLIITDSSVTEIAFSCGFSDMSYFSKVFSRYMGMSPKQFRKKQAVLMDDRHESVSKGKV